MQIQIRELKKSAAVSFILCHVLCSLITQSTYAANMKHHVSSVKIKQVIHQALRQDSSLKNVYSILQNQYGLDAVPALETLLKNEKEDDEVRWVSLFSIAKIKGKNSISFLRTYMKHRHWLLRDAALKSAAALNAYELNHDIEVRVKDIALTVRTTAVDTIGHMQLKESLPKIVDALFDDNNYHKGKPLWIHQHILKVITDMKYTLAAPKLLRLLDSKHTKEDQEFQKQIIGTLEKISNKNFQNKPLPEQIRLWKQTEKKVAKNVAKKKSIKKSN